MVLSTTKKIQCVQSLTNNTCILGGPKKAGIISTQGRNANLNNAIFSRGVYSNGNMPLGCIAGFAYLKANNLLTNNPSCSGGVGRMSTNNTRCSVSNQTNNKNSTPIYIPSIYDYYEFTSPNPIADYGLGSSAINNRITSFVTPINIAIINISNSGRSESGEIIEELINNSSRNFTLLSRHTVHMNQFETTLNECISNANIRAIITIGGTGISSTDNVVDVCEKKYDKYLPGFGELFRYLTYVLMRGQRYSHGFPSIDSRPSAGICNNKVIYSLPGSPQAARMGFIEIINESTHPIIAQLDKVDTV